MKAALETPNQAVVATVVAVEGSAYRRPGAKMLVQANGQAVGMVLGGCLEQELIEQAQQVLITGKIGRTELSFAAKDWWPGCGGQAQVWLMPVTPLFREWFLATQTQPGVLVTLEDGAQLAVYATSTAGDLGNLQAEAVAVARTLLEKQPQKRTLAGQEAFFDVAKPALRLVIFGAGPDALVLATQAQLLGFQVVAVDSRPAQLEVFSCTTLQLNPAQYAQYGAQLALQKSDSVVIMHHQPLLDAQSLRFALDSGAGYVGLLGPRGRLELTQFSPEQLSRLHTPIGLDIGADTPEEIALAIMAEITASQRGFGAGFLRQKEGPIHQALAGVG
jgi:xanthine dehydrogenase accessory factor